MEYDKTINSANETYGNIGRECPDCGASFPANASFCSTDGSKLIDSKSETMSHTVFAEKYEILEKIGSGGMGTVYKVRQKLLDKILALKITPPEYLNDQALTRFQREAKMMAALSHPNLGRIYDFGIWANQPFIAMEYIDGVPLSTHISTGELSTTEAVSLFTEVLNGLAHAHREGVLHRDIKPSNIMVQTKSSQRRAILLDFGIAKKIDNLSGDVKLQALTRTGEMIGSPLYMSPEQARGERLTAKSDLYSVGCSLFEALTGTAPFVGKTAVETIFLHLEQSPPTLKEASLGKEFDPALETIIKKLLSKDPENRFESAEALVLALKNFGSQSEEPHESPIKEVSSEKPKNFKPADKSYRSVVVALLVCLCGIGVVLAYKAIESAIPAKSATETKNRGLDELVQMATATRRPQQVYRNAQRDFGDDAFSLETDQIPENRLSSIKQFSTALPSLNPKNKIELSIENKKLTAKDIEFVTRNTEATTIALNGSKFEHRILGLLRKQVLELQLADVRLYGHDFDLIGKNRNLESLILRNNKVSANNLLSLKHLDKISQLDMQFSALSADEIRVLRIFPQLLVLNVGGNNHIDDSAAPEFVNLKSLLYLDVSHTSMTEIGLRKLANMPNCRTLCAKKLMLYDESLECFSKHKRLRSLALARNQITGIGIKYLVPLNLLNLDVSANPLNESAITEILKLKSLDTVKLSSTDLAREDYLKLTQLPHLKRLHVRNCSNFNEDDAREFMQRSPVCVEIFYGATSLASLKRADLRTKGH